MHRELSCDELRCLSEYEWEKVRTIKLAAQHSISQSERKPCLLSKLLLDRMKCSGL